MSDEIVIRDLAPADVEAVEAIALAAWAPFFDHLREAIGEAFFAADFPDWRAAKAEQVRRGCTPADGAMAWVAQRGGRVIGFITAYVVNAATGMAEIGNNAVHPDHQGRGVGQAMCRHVLGHLKNLGLKYVRVGTGADPHHAAARRAYEKVGFAVRIPEGFTYYRAL